MTKDQFVELKMMEAVSAFFEQHPELLTQSPMLNDSVLLLRSRITMLRANESVQSNVLTGVNSRKEEVRKLINGLMIRNGKILIAYYSLKEKALEGARTESAIERIRYRKEAEILNLVKTVHDDAVKEDAAELQKANLTMQDIADMMAYANTYHLLATGEMISREERVQATANIENLLRKGKEQVNRQIGGFMRSFEKNHAELVELFDQVKMVDYPARRPRKTGETDENATTAMVTFRFTDTSTGEPVEGVAIAINGAVSSDFSDDGGEIYLDTLAPGSYLVAASAPGYQSRQWNTPDLMAGEEYTFEELLSPEA